MRVTVHGEVRGRRTRKAASVDTWSGETLVR
jgi:hypothetical protein